MLQLKIKLRTRNREKNKILSSVYEVPRSEPISLTILNSLFYGVAASFVLRRCYRVKKRQTSNDTGRHAP